MVSELDSFLQFIAAICFTITIDSSVFQRFWNADYYGIVERCISKYKVHTSTPKDKDLDRFIREQKRLIENKGRRQGAYLLLVSCLLIVYELFEPLFVEEEGVHNIAISLVLLFSLIVTSTNWLKNWIKVVGLWGATALILVVLTILSCLYASELSEYVGLTMSRIVLRVLLVVSIGVPVGCRFLYNWLYTNRYPRFLEASLYEEKKEYEGAKDSIRNKTKENLSTKYKSAFSDAYMNTKRDASNEEDVVASCTDIYYEEVENIVRKHPSIWRLLKKSKGISQLDEETAVLPIPQLNVINEDIMSNLLKEYENLSPKPKLKVFCSKNHLDYNTFQDYRNKHNKASSQKNV